MISDTLSPPTVPMTTVNVPLSEATKQELGRRAAAKGVPLEEFARTILEREVPVPAPPKPVDKSAEEWVADWLAWTSSHVPRQHNLDDSREPIYEGCGE
jgi:hypothetical protein